RVGIIVPSGIASDYYNQEYFNTIVKNQELVSLFDFENREKLFLEVDSRMKFCLLTLTGRERPVEEAEYLFFAHSVADLADSERLFTLSPADIARINPNTKTAPIFRSRRDAELTKAIYRRVPVLIEEGPPENNPWGIKFSTMFHMSNDSHLFRTREELEGEGWRLEGNRFASTVRRDGKLQSEVYLPLYEAKMIHHFDHRWATFEGLETRDVTAREKAGPAFSVLPRYWVDHDEVDGRIESPARWFLVFRDIARTTDVRTAIFSATPRVAVGNNAPIVLFSPQTKGLATLLGASLSSFVFDFVARMSIGSMHLNFYIFKQLPVLPPETYDQPCPWAALTPSLPTPYSLFLLPRILELTHTAYDLRPFAQDLGYFGPPFRWDEERRF